MNIKPIMESAKSSDESEAVNSIEFYPAERVREIFARLAGARGTPKEAAELRIFAGRMEYLYKNQSGETVYFMDNEELIRYAAYGEAIEDALRTKALEAGAGHV